VSALAGAGIAAGPATPAADAAIDARALRKTFGSLVAVEGLTLSVKKGEVFGMLGPNGSGKTTAIRMFCALLAPSAGAATVAGCDVGTQGEKVRRLIGYMSQRYGLYDDLTVEENINFYSAIYGLYGSDRAARIATLMAELGLEDRAKQLGGTLSGGWKQRLALACATAHEPPVLFLDEPTAGVDPASRRRFWVSIHEMASRGTTILVTTHYMDEAARCDRLAFMSRGHLIALGTPEEVTHQFGLASVEDVFIELQRRDEQRLTDSGQRTAGAR